MGRHPNPTHDDIFSARTEAPAAAQQLALAMAEAAKPIVELAKTERVSPAEVIAAVAAMRTSQAAVDAAMYRLLHLAVQGGAGIGAAAAAVGIRRETLARRLKVERGES